MLFKKKKEEPVKVQKKIDYPPMVLSMKSILMYEKLTGNVFQELNTLEEIQAFMYCVFVCSTDIKITYEVFLTMLEHKRFADHITREFKRMWGYIQQFQPQKKEEAGSGETESEISMTNYINTLVLDYGIDIDYAMNHMEMWEIEQLYEAATSYMHTTMEDKRLWAYIQMLPNFDKKHRNITVEKFLPFPWEKETNKKKAEKELAAETQRAKSIIGADINALFNKTE